MEIWKDVVGYEGLYEVSNQQRIRTKKGRYLKPSFDNHGYKQINLTKDGLKKCRKYHRLVGFAFVPNPENKPCINHKNGIKHDNVPENLEWCTYSENNAHSYAIGLASNKGENCPVNKLNNEQVLKIYASRNMKAKDLAKEYNVSIWAINDLRKGKTWDHITQHNESRNRSAV